MDQITLVKNIYQHLKYHTQELTKQRNTQKMDTKYTTKITSKDSAGKSGTLVTFFGLFWDNQSLNDVYHQTSLYTFQLNPNQTWSVAIAKGSTEILGGLIEMGLLTVPNNLLEGPTPQLFNLFFSLYQGFPVI